LILPLAIKGTVHRPTKTDALLAQVDDIDLSELCRTINEPADLGGEYIDETVSANTLNDSLTIEKEINNGQTPSQMTEIDISSIDNKHDHNSDRSISSTCASKASVFVVHVDTVFSVLFLVLFRLRWPTSF
jgi:hypothetical protein